MGIIVIWRNCTSMVKEFRLHFCIRLVSETPNSLHIFTSRLNLDYISFVFVEQYKDYILQFSFASLFLANEKCRKVWS